MSAGRKMMKADWIVAGNRRFWLAFLVAWTFFIVADAAERPAGSDVEGRRGPFEFDAGEKSYQAKKGDKEAVFKFSIRNILDQEVVIEDVQTSCGCTSVIKRNPWKVGPGMRDEIEVRMDLLGRSGKVTKSVYVFTNSGTHTLKVNSLIPASVGSDQNPSTSPQVLTERQRNQLVALRDRQTVFRGKCANCHVKPVKGLTGKKLYERGCGICHNSPNRASMVPDLAKLDKKMDRTYWEVWIKYGRKGSLMPAFHRSQGGPLDDKQVESLISYLLENKPTGIIDLHKELEMQEEKKDGSPKKVNPQFIPGNFNVLKPVEVKDTDKKNVSENKTDSGSDKK